VNEGDLRSLNVVQVGERTRLVLNLGRNMNYKTRLDGKALYVILSPIVRVGDSAAERATRFAEESAVGSKHSYVTSCSVGARMVRDELSWT
jgi:type IV pilus assembly protein PilQ